MIDKESVEHLKSLPGEESVSTGHNREITISTYVDDAIAYGSGTNLLLFSVYVS
jgi:hypothetical protein